MARRIVYFLALAGLLAAPASGGPAREDTNMKFRKLSPEETIVIEQRGTEAPFSGKYNDNFEKGIYSCKRCGAALFLSEQKFKSSCGWPSFDDEIPGSVERRPDPDGMRTEIVCARCGAHLGHVFEGEGLTPKNLRHCVNSISMDFIPREQVGRAIFAGGCFWGVEYQLERATGVISTTAGYIGGKGESPSYEEVCSHTTGYAEAVEVLFDRRETSFEDLAKLFFEIHDPTQLDRQGPDVGDQYRSAIFYLDQHQKEVAESLIDALEKRGLKIATRLEPASTFWPAEDYHQDYYRKKNSEPYCHIRTPRF